MDSKKMWQRAAIAIIGGSAVVSLIVLAFVWPTRTIAIHNIPVSVSGDSAAAMQLENMLDSKEPGTFKFETASSRDDAFQQVVTRKTYGAIALNAPGTPSEIIIASGASPIVANALTGLAGQLQATVTNAAPLAANDPTGSGLAAASFPLTIGGLIGAALTVFLAVGLRRRAAVLLGYSAIAGLSLSAILGSWLGFLEGGYAINALAIAVSIIAISAFVAGLATLLGRPGFIFGAVFTFLFANPISAAALPWQFIAEPWGQIGQYLVPGAAANLIRTINYFPNADLTQQWLTLSIWAAVGLALVVVGSLIRVRKAK